MTCVCYAVVGCSAEPGVVQEIHAGDVRRALFQTMQALGQGRGGGIGLILLVFLVVAPSASFTFTSWTARVVGVRMSSSAWADAVTSSSVAVDHVAGGETGKEHVMFNRAVVFSSSVKGVERRGQI